MSTIVPPITDKSAIFSIAFHAITTNEIWNISELLVTLSYESIGVHTELCETHELLNYKNIIKIATDKQDIATFEFKAHLGGFYGLL